MSIRTAIVDDELHIIEGLSKMLIDKCPQIEITGNASSLTEGKELLRSKPIDLLFLDIKIGCGNGFQLLKDLDPVDFQIIFITAYDEYALEAFRFSAIDYLLKPIDPENLVQSVNKAEKALYSDNVQTRLQHLLLNYQNQNGNKTIVLNTQEACYVVKIKDIVQCEAKGNYTLFHLKDEPNILVSKTLKKFDQILSKFNFFRCHQSHLVNMNAIKKFDKRDGGSLVLTNNNQIPVSIRRKEQLLGIFNH